MSEPLKPNRNHRHVYAILRVESDADDGTPIELRITVKKVVVDPDDAEQEVKRLNALNAGKGCHYVSRVTRFEDVPVAVEALPSAQLATSDGNRP